MYAAERAFADEAREVTYEAVHRMVAWYLHTASAANAVVAPQRDTVPLEPLPPGCTSLTFRDISGALDWCTQERANIVAATRQAADEGLHDIAWKLPVAVLGCFNALSYRAEWLASHLVALASARRAGDRQAEAWVLNNLGMVCIQQRMDDAIGYFDQALAIGRDIGDRRAEAQAANNLADAYIELGRPEDALEPLKRTLALQIEVGHRYGQGVTLNNLGEAYLDLGRPEEAIDSIEQARSIFVEIKTLRGEGSVAHNLGRAYMDLGRPDEAVRYFLSALHIRQAAGERHGQAADAAVPGPCVPPPRPDRGCPAILDRCPRDFRGSGRRGAACGEPGGADVHQCPHHMRGTAHRTSVIRPGAGYEQIDAHRGGGNSA